jgi:hypothetical protein
MRTWKWQACTSNFYRLARFSRATSVKADSGADQESSQTRLLQRFGGCPLFDLQTPDVLETPTPAQQLRSSALAAVREVRHMLHLNRFMKRHVRTPVVGGVSCRHGSRKTRGEPGQPDATATPPAAVHATRRTRSPKTDTRCTALLRNHIGVNRSARRRGGSLEALLEDVVEAVRHKLFLRRVERPQRPVEKQGRQAVHGSPCGGVEALAAIGCQHAGGNQVVDATDQNLERMILPDEAIRRSG